MNIKEYIVKLVQKKKRVGRGIGSGRGKTCGRGTKGQKARKSGLTRPGFEGGQTPLNQRISKYGGSYSKKTKKEFCLINLTQLENDKNILENQTIDYSQSKKPVKILGDGNLTKKGLTIHAVTFTKSAQAKIEQAGGHIKIIKTEKSPKRATK